MKISIRRMLGLFVPLILLAMVYGLFHLAIVRADNTGGGSSGSLGSCSGDYDWCWNAGGVRLALYKLDSNGQLSYYGHMDHCSTVGSLGCPSGNAYQDATVAGKVAHQSVSGYASGTWTSKSISINNTYKFSDIQDGWSALEQETKSLFSLNTNNNATILAALKSEFSGASNLTEADLANLYITIEPTIYLTEKASGNSYYGTAYEFNKRYSSGTYLYGVASVVHYWSGTWIQAETIAEGSANAFVGPSANYVKLTTSTLADTNTSGFWSETNNSVRAANATKITSTEGFGINVFWLKNYTTEVPTVVAPTCTITQINDRQFSLNISGDATSYGISNTQTYNGQTLYTSSNTTEIIYGIVANSAGSNTCQLNRIAYSCTVNSSDGFNYTLTHNLPSSYLAGVGLSNTSGNLNGNTTYKASNSDTKVYGVVKGTSGQTYTCEAPRTTYSCAITSSDTFNYNLLINNKSASEYKSNSAIKAYNISNIDVTSDKLLTKDSATYYAKNTDSTIYGKVKLANDEVITCPKITRTPYSCEITKQGNTDVYNLTIKGQDVNQVLYGISNTNGTINNKKTYTAVNTDKMIYGTVTDKDGKEVTTCSLERTPVTCTINTTDDKNYTLTINNPIDGLKGIIYGYTKLGVSSTDNKDTYLAKWNDVKLKGVVSYSDGEEMVTCEMKRDEETCPSTCAGKEGAELLSCAEDFCQMSQTDTDSKKTCITTCGYSEPEFESCPSDSVVTGKNTICKNSTLASKETCTPATVETYYKTVCEEISGIKYPGNLPSVLLPGTGFTYEPILSGKKTCELVFEKEKWMFDYAVSYTDEEREKLVEILENYTTNIDSIIKEASELYKYSSSDADIEMIITEDGQEEGTSVLLKQKETNNLLKEELQKIEGPDIRITLYNDGTENGIDIYKYLRIISSNETTYQLRGICISKEDGSLYEPMDGVCSVGDELVHEYITDSDVTVQSYDTKVIVNKESSNLGVNNTCYYNINKPIDDEEEVNPETGDGYVVPIIIGLLLITGVAGFTYKKVNERKKNI